MKKIILLVVFLILFIPNSLLAVSSNEVDYEVYDYIVDASIDISGNMVVKEIIGIKGSFNGYIRDLQYKNDNLNSFDGSLKSFEGSSIYNASNIELYKVGTVSWNGDLEFGAFNNDVTLFHECSNNKGCYEVTNLDNIKSIKMYNETIDDITYFYVEYLLGNVVVLHDDVSELYYNFIGDSFDDDIRRYQLRVSLPYETSEQIRVWAHGPLDGNVYFIEKDGLFYGGYLEVNDLYRNTPVDIRMTFPKSLISVDHPFLKKSNVEGLDKILDVEEKRADDANRQRKIAKIKVYGTYTLSTIYILSVMGLIIYVYFKHDKEFKSSFEGEYYREFIDEYDVTVIEYLFDKKISEKAFSTSILNMIYKKNISFKEIGKKDYELTKINEDNLSDAEKQIMNIIFDQAGNKDKNTTTLKKIKSYAESIEGTNSPFLNLYRIWNKKVTEDSISEGFYENKTKTKICYGLFGLFGLALLIMYISIEVFNILTLLVIIVTIVYLIYLIAFNKRTRRGAEHYIKWKAFKKFLEDFGRFDEKELPEVVLWERYLVYASIFGIADKVGKTMKIKFNNSNMTNSTDTDLLFNYMMWTNLNYSINHTIHSSVSTANKKISQARMAESNYSSGGGFGGGFSSGGGFGGGGGGGRGF